MYYRVHAFTRMYTRAHGLSPLTNAMETHVKLMSNQCLPHLSALDYICLPMVSGVDEWGVHPCKRVCILSCLVGIRLFGVCPFPFYRTPNQCRLRRRLSSQSLSRRADRIPYSLQANTVVLGALRRAGSLRSLNALPRVLF
ncbi:hypothetical protein ARMSODRAFT_169141 [Armillaria solidipes]|uniref:Uncharacterized protein n=1 Tax=Armillaria solidipes TaxID=1076256 RepID=A0A2H3AGY6_9AGAR|nr:hypothetical protein ARMSODRAFT_169141 [Armillaria solidipes]